MRNIIIGTIGVLWGGAILLVSWFGSGSGDAKPLPSRVNPPSSTPQDKRAVTFLDSFFWALVYST
jgi:hypothetical protein